MTACQTEQACLLRKQEIRRLFFKMGVLVVLTAGLGYAIYHQLESFEIKRQFQRQSQIHELATGIIFRELRYAVRDTLYWPEQMELHNCLNHNENSCCLNMANEYLAFIRISGRYDQIRFLDHRGMEQVRVNFRQGDAQIVAKDDLQDKSSRYYFTESLDLSTGQIYISPLDLNMEAGKIERPFKPMIRFSTPVFDANGDFKGVIVLNFLANQVLKSLATLGDMTQRQVMLVNQDGYWLLSDKKEDEWGFMFADRRDRRFATRFPDVWKTIQDKSASRHIISKRGLFTSRQFDLVTMFLMDETPSYLISEADFKNSPKWYLVIRDTPDVLDRTNNSNLLILLIAGLFLIASLCSWFYVKMERRIREVIHHKKLYHLAHFDSLTQLPNRALFFDRLERAIGVAKRHDRHLGLLFIDLDGFKDINDTMGHDAGDRALQLVAERLQAMIRVSDTAARLGGDEFVVLLTEVASQDGATTFADRLIAQLSQPYRLPNQTVHFGASIGIALLPDHADSKDTLLSAADQAMYRAKQAGKNQWRLASKP